VATESESSNASPNDKADRKPYVVVLMSEEMKAALTQYAADHDTTPTALCRQAAAQAIGYDLSKEPQPTARSKYTSDEERDAAHKVASKKSGLLRKALLHMHVASTSKPNPALAAAALAVVTDLTTPNKRHTAAELEALDRTIADAQSTTGTQ